MLDRPRMERPNRSMGPGQGMGLPRPNMGSPRPNMGPPRPDMRPYVGPPGPEFGPPEPGMGPPKPGMGSPGPDMGPPGPDMRTYRHHMRPQQGMGAPGPYMGPPGPGMGPPGPGMEPPGPGFRSPEPDTRPYRNHTEPGPYVGHPGPGFGRPGPDMGPHGPGFGPPGPAMGPHGPAMGPHGPGFGPPGPDMGPHGPGFGHPGSDTGPHGPGFGPHGSNMGPHGPGSGPPGPDTGPHGPGFGPHGPDMGPPGPGMEPPGPSMWPSRQNMDIPGISPFTSTSNGTSTFDALGSSSSSSSSLALSTNVDDLAPSRIPVLGDCGSVMKDKSSQDYWNKVLKEKVSKDYWDAVCKRSQPVKLQPELTQYKNSEDITYCHNTPTNAPVWNKPDSEGNHEFDASHSVKMITSNPRLQNRTLTYVTGKDKAPCKISNLVQLQPELTEFKNPEGKTYHHNTPTNAPVWSGPVLLHSKERPKTTEASQTLTSVQQNAALGVKTENSTGESEKKAVEERKKQPEAVEDQKPVNKSRPVASTPVPGTVWSVVRTSDGRHFFYNPSKRHSVWKRPEELKNRPDVDKLLSHKPEVKIEIKEEKDVLEEPPSKKINGTMVG